MDEQRPTLTGERVTIRPGGEGDVDPLLAILGEPSVARWWGEPESREEVLGKLGTSSDVVLLVVEVGGEVAGGIEYHEESTPEYRHAGIDVYLAERFQGRGLGAEAVRHGRTPCGGYRTRYAGAIFPEPCDERNEDGRGRGQTVTGAVAPSAAGGASLPFARARITRPASATASDTRQRAYPIAVSWSFSWKRTIP